MNVRELKELREKLRLKCRQDIAAINKVIELLEENGLHSDGAPDGALRVTNEAEEPRTVTEAIEHMVSGMRRTKFTVPVIQSFLADREVKATSQTVRNCLAKLVAQGKFEIAEAGGRGKAGSYVWVGPRTTAFMRRVRPTRRKAPKEGKS